MVKSAGATGAAPGGYAGSERGWAPPAVGDQNRAMADFAQARWRPADVDAQAGLAHEGGDATLEALVQRVEVTDDAEGVLAEQAERLGMSIDELRQVPFLLVGTADEIVAAVRGHRERWGITRYAVRRAGLDALGLLLPRLAAV